jgi:acyl-phosphate glycerol 3-phosphate acyltransferase
METFLLAAAGYFIGSIPVAYLLAKKRHGIDLRTSGSRNIGARNAYEATGNKRIGFAVLVLDMHKGIIPLVILDKFGFCDAIPIVAITIIFGHCYPIWLKFHGGRGLATAAAIAILISPVLLLLWIVLYLFMGILKSQVHFQAFFATAGCLFFELVAQGNSFVGRGGILCSDDHLHISIIIILLIILSRHIEPVYALLKKTSV